MSLELLHLGKRFGEVEAVRDLSLELEAGELMTLLGPSGCGKTTALRLIAGFETPDVGRVLFRGEEVTGQSPQRRGFGMVFQNYALFPHLSVFENVAFGLKAHRKPAGELGGLVERALGRVDLAGFGARRVQELSGGQQQRVALARALAIEPPLLLLDEPLSNLDAALRERTRTELRTLIKGLGITALYVTHDQEEAFDLSDRVAVMNAGELRQVGTPEELYDTPRDVFVAGFVGRANVLPGTLEAASPEELSVRLAGDVIWELGRAGRFGPDGGPTEAGLPVRVVVRPEALEVSVERQGSGVGERKADELAGVLRERVFRGSRLAYRIELPDGSTLEVETERSGEALGGEGPPGGGGPGREPPGGGGPGGEPPGGRIAVRPRPDACIHIYPAGP